MNPLTEEQINAVIDWMNIWDQLKNSSIPIRFRTDWTKQLNIDDDKVRPPLGLRPKWIHDLIRQKEIMEAMTRYMEADKKIPKEWAIEFASYCE